MSLQGLFDCRNFMVSMETTWQATLCFAHGCFPNLGFHFYFTQSPNASSLSGLTSFRLMPSVWESTPTFAIDALYSQCNYTWCSWVPLVPESIGLIDQFSLNVFSMANVLVFGLLFKDPLHLVFGLNKPFSINFWV